jgi:hypothetical protein
MQILTTGLDKSYLDNSKYDGANADMKRLGIGP